jgi:hypothetical protein
MVFNGCFFVSSLMQFSNFVIGKMKERLQVDAVYTDFLKAFDRVKHKFLLCYLWVKFCTSLLCFTGRTQQVGLDDYLSGTIHCHYGVSQGSHLDPFFFIADINKVLGIFEHPNVLGFADDLKLYMMVVTVENCHRFQSDLDDLNEWCLVNKFDLNVEKYKSILFCRNMRPIQFDYRIGENALERVEEIKVLNVFLDDIFILIEVVISKPSRILGFIQRVSREIGEHNTHKLLYVSFVRPILEYATSVRSPHQEIHSASLREKHYWYNNFH